MSFNAYVVLEVLSMASETFLFEYSMHFLFLPKT